MGTRINEIFVDLNGFLFVLVQRQVPTSRQRACQGLRLHLEKSSFSLFILFWAVHYAHTLIPWHLLHSYNLRYVEMLKDIDSSEGSSSGVLIRFHTAADCKAAAESALTHVGDIPITMEVRLRPFHGTPCETV